MAQLLIQKISPLTEGDFGLYRKKHYAFAELYRLYKHCRHYTEICNVDFELE